MHSVSPPRPFLTFLLQGLLPGILLIACTFPEFNPVYGPGIDPPLAWVFNHIFSLGNTPGREFVFPHGPLSFLLYPLPMGHHILIGLSIYTLLKLIFFFQVLWLYRLDKPGEWLLPLLLIYIAFLLFEIQFVMLGIIVSGFSIYLKSGEHRFLILPLLVAALGLFMRAYITVTGGFAVLGSLVIFWIEQRNGRTLAYYLSIGLAAVVLLWMSLYQTFSGLIHYLTGRVYLAVDNSTAASYYPDNNWALLFLSLICLFAIPFIQRNKKVTLYFLLFMPILFAQWKYSMAREDLIHSRGYFVMLALFFILLLPHIHGRKLATLVLGLLSMCFYYMNLPGVIGYTEYNVNLVKVNPFMNFMTNYPTLEKSWIRQSVDNIRENKIDDSMKQLIGNQTVDCYPWDYSFIPANGLNWQPRPCIQSYASYTSWLDKQNAVHFNGATAPEFLLWHLAKNPMDPNGSSFETLDDRYPLNDEPQTMAALLSLYTLKSKNDKILLFQKRAKAHPLKITSLQKSETPWNTWTKVPASKNGLIRVKADIRNNELGAMKSFIYKNEACFILLKTASGQVYRYRIVPKNAVDGIWIAPLVQHPEKNGAEPEISEIQFTSTNIRMQKEKIALEWECLDSENTGGSGFIPNWFGKNSVEKDRFIWSGLNTTEPGTAHWEVNEKQFYTNDFKSAPRSFEVDSNGFSFLCSYETDSVWAAHLNKPSLDVYASVWTKAKGKSEAGLIIAYEANNELLYYKSSTFADFISDTKNWNIVINNAAIPADHLRKGYGKLKVYVWNSGREKLLIDDFQVTIK